MALGWKKTPAKDDPRLTGHETTYSSRQGGWVKAKPKPVPGTPKPRKK
ncbi:hypothetical protein KVH27_19515 [Streptomyces olivaceus]|nr:hypothetical protein [Streptomyces olivaceus]MBZ6250557.1 hypothetical protein [Streptomyces olivaceus]